MAQQWQADGVISGLGATLAGTTVTVTIGALFVHGYYGELQNPASITGVGTNGTVVAGVDLSAQTISLYYRDGVLDYGSNPASNYEQDTSKWEIPLWLVSGTTLVDLRTMLTPGAACGWWNTAPGPVSVASTVSVNQAVLTLRVPYAGKALLRGEILVTYTDSRTAQSAICGLTYQQGQSDQQLTPTITPATPGGGPGPGPPYQSEAVSLSGLITVTQGKKVVGWRVTAGTGPGLSLTTMTASVEMWSLPATA
jgi:hypothetical protein